MTHSGDVDRDRLAIRQVVENWVLWRDAGDWDRFATVWHDDGWMSATWFQGPAREFIRASREAFDRGVNILHVLGGTTVDIAGNRAIAQTRMTIHQRAPLDGVPARKRSGVKGSPRTTNRGVGRSHTLVDVACIGRFYDFFEKRGGRWAIVRRQPIYEKDRVDVVDPASRVTLNPALLASFPEGYRHLAYLQARNGFTVRHGLPELRGQAVEQLYAEGRAWLSRR